MKTTLLVALVCAVNLCFAQPTLQSYGAPFVKSNVRDLKVMQTRYTNTGTCDTIAVLIDIGEEDGSSTLNFQAVFVPLNGTCSYATIKDFAGTDVSVYLGKPSSTSYDNSTPSVHGLDGNLYIGTDGDGGHLIRIDMRNKTAVDLGKPYSSSTTGKITALNIGADFSVCGILQEGNQMYAFKYKYGCSFDLLAHSGSSPYNLNAYIAANYSTFINPANVATDSVYTYVQASNTNNTNYMLFAINNSTNEVKAVDLVTGIGGGYLYGGYFYIDTYGEDKVYVRKPTGLNEIVLSSGNLVLSSSATPVGKRPASKIWTSKALNAVGDYVTSYNNDDFKFHLEKTGVDSRDINLYDCIRKIGKPITALAPYIDGVTGDTSLFVHGFDAKLAYRFSLSAATLTPIGANSHAAFNAVTNLDDYSQVYIGGTSGSGGVIQKYSSGSAWQYNTNINPEEKYNVANPPYSNPPNKLPWLLTMKMLRNPAYIIGAGVNGAQRTGATGDETGLAIVNPSNGYIREVYQPIFSDFVYGHKAMDIDQKNKYIIIGGTKPIPNSWNTHGGLMVLDTLGQLKCSFYPKKPNGDTIYSVKCISVDTSGNLFFSDGGALYVITNYTTKGTTSTTAETADRIYHDNNMAMGIRAMELLPDLKYIALAMEGSDTKVHIVDVTDRNRYYPSNLGNTVIVGNSIPASDGRAIEFAFVGKYGFVGGTNSLWGFDYSSVTTPVLDFDLYDAQKTTNGGTKPTLSIGTDIQTIKTFPNPAKQQVNVSITAAANQSSSIEVFDAKGKLVSSKTVQMVLGKNSFNINIQNLAAGLYIIKIGNGTTFKTQRFIKQ